MSVVKGKLVKMEVIHVGEYEFTKQDIIGHGAFAMVYKGRKRKVGLYLLYAYYSTFVEYPTFAFRTDPFQIVVFCFV